MSHKHLFITLPAVSLMLNGFTPAFAEEPSDGGVGWIGVLIVLVLLIPLVWWLMRSSGVKVTDHAHASTDPHAPIQSSLPLESEAIDLAPMEPTPVHAEDVAAGTKEVVENGVDQMGEAAAEGRTEVEAVAPTPEKMEPTLITAADQSQPIGRAHAAGKPDNLLMIEGIGPKIARLLQENGISTFAELAASDRNRVKEILKKAGLGNLADPESWAEQAQLAADGKWDELKTLQNILRRGRRV
jgi:predicted flap endonuclease-1-like 5' DNA nuclease